MMSNKNYTCAVSGNRVIQKDLDKNRLKEIFIKLITNAKINTFLVGMALGFDTICFNVLETLKSEYDIKIVACIPCRTQDYNFTKKQKEEYDRMLSVADEKIYVSNEYNNTCMFKRNRFLVDNSSILVVYSRKKTGGTIYTKNYALKKGVPIIEI